MMRDGVYKPGVRYLGWGADPSLSFAKFICLPGKPNRAHRLYCGRTGEQFETVKSLMEPLVPLDTRPQCAKADCPRHGRKMYRLRSNTFQTKDGAGKVTITYFECKPGKPYRSHYTHLGPNGEKAVRVLPDGQIGSEGQGYSGDRGGYFRFTDRATGQIVETKFGVNPDRPHIVAQAMRRDWQNPQQRNRRIRSIKKTLSEPGHRELMSQTSRNNWARRNAEHAARDARIAYFESKLKGRPRRDDQRKRVKELVSLGLKWPQIREVMNAQFHESNSVDSYQALLRSRKK